MAPSSNEIVKKLNILINEAICHGADAGGSYGQNEKNLVKAINSVVKTLGLDDEYEVVNCTKNNIDIIGIDTSYGGWFIIPRGIVENINNDNNIITHVDFPYENEWKEEF